MDSLTDQDFMFIERFLLSFKELGGNADGTIDYNIFQRYISEERNSEREILNLLNEEDCIHDNKLNYLQLCASILASKTAFNNLSMENGRISNGSILINTQTYTRKKSSALTSMKSDTADEVHNSKIFKQEVGGSLYNIDEDFFGNRYLMEILEDSSIEINVKHLKCTGTENVPIELLILQEKDKLLITSFLIHSEEYCTINHYFKKGKYILVPVCFFWPQESCEAVNLASLIDLSDDGQVVITDACETALRTVFDSIDLDQNGLLSQLEFDLFIQYTSGETAANEWSTIEDNFHVEDQQLTFDGFVELYKMVLQTDPSDVTHMLQLMGMNKALKQQNAWTFTLLLHSDTSQFLFSPLPVASYKVIAEKGLCKMTIEQGSSKKVKNMNDLFIYTLKLPHQVTVVIQNQSHSKVKVRLDCSRSINFQSHRHMLDCVIDIMPRTSALGHYLVLTDPLKSCSFECLEELK